MAESKKLTDFVAASFDALDLYEAGQEALAEGGEHPPASGDVYVLEATKEFGVEWAVIARDPADLSRFLVVPADSHVLAGSADVELEDDSPVGALKLRCRFGAWLDGELLRPELRVGVLGREGLVQARQRWLDVGDGGVTGDVLGREVDDDPSYQDWVEDVLVVARRALIGAKVEKVKAVDEAPGIPIVDEATIEEKIVPPARRFPSSTFLPIAASIVVAVTSAQLWRLSGKVQDLETASRGADERHGVVVRQLETERDRLTSERDRLTSERDRLSERQKELEVAGKDREQEARELRQRVAALDQKLVDAEQALVVVNPAVAFFSPPVEEERGKVEVTISPEQTYVVVFLSLMESSPAPWYQLKVRVKGEEEPIWTTDRLVFQRAGEVRVGLPIRVLRRGEFELELLALEGETVRRVAEYELVLSLDPDTVKRRRSLP